MSWLFDKLGEEIREGDTVYYAAGRIFQGEILSIRDRVNIDGVFRLPRDVVKTLPVGGVLFAQGTKVRIGKCLRVFPHSVRVRHRRKTYLMKKEDIVC